MKLLKLYDLLLESVDRDMFEDVDESQLSEDYPVNFDIFQFKNIRSYAEKLRYAKEHLGNPIGKGSSRSVYRVDTYKVLKLAMNKKGVAQNEVEINWGGDSYYAQVLADVFDYDRDNHYWVEMEVAFKPKKSDFTKLWNIKFDDLQFYLGNKREENRGRRGRWYIDPEVKNRMNENEHVQLLLSFMYDSDATPGDLSKLNSWGLVRRQDGENLVLIDFGLTNEVYESYYK